MNRGRSFKNIVFAMVIAVFVLACGGEVVASTPTMLPSTNTPLPTNTTLPTKTPKPAPTATELPPTPSPLGSVVQSEIFEVKVVVAEKRGRVYPGGKFYFTAADGFMLVDIGIKVSELTNSTPAVIWNDVYLMNNNSEWWIPSFGTFKDADNELDPFAIGVSEVEIDPAVEVPVTKNGYLRLFFHIPENGIYYFGFYDSPLTEIHFK